ncbi:MAG: hypothetical protein KI790_02840 [Cyclobacteriaceae bacterium]|nr:hypothetical protein [Cyclobacteriaceae bacterium HetDA_MAG_MS6]
MENATPAIRKYRIKREENIFKSSSYHMSDKTKPIKKKKPKPIAQQVKDGDQSEQVSDRQDFSNLGLPDIDLKKVLGCGG